MSLSEYRSALPGFFPITEDATESAQASTGRPNAGDAETQGGKREAEIPQPSTKAGFADIIEIQTMNKDGGFDSRIMPTSRYLPKGTRHTSKGEKYEDHVLVLRRTAVQREQKISVLRVELEIQSHRLCEAARKVMRNCYEHTNLHSFPIKIRAPFSELFFCRQEIQEMAEDTNTDPALRQEMRLLHNFILNNGLLSSIVHDHDRYSNKGQVACDILWTIYPPNSLAILKTDMVQECWVVRDVLQRANNQGYFWEVTGLRVGYDGRGPVFTRQTCIAARVAVDLENISDLPLIPVDYFPDWNNLKAILTARYEKVKRIVGEDFNSFSVQTYAGTAWDYADFRQGYAASEPPLKTEKQIDDRVIVDYKAFEDFTPRYDKFEDLRDRNKARKKWPAVKARGMVVDQTQVSDSDNSDSDSDSDEGTSPIAVHQEMEIREILDFMSLDRRVAEASGPSHAECDNDSPIGLTGLAQTIEQVLHVSKEDFKLLFPALLPAFGLKSKKWRWVLTDDLHDVVWNPAAYDSLQHDPSTKDLIHALVKGHKKGLKTGFDDLIMGKGQGLIFLLHGEPGLGKTLTAESIADYLQRPLYSISGGEIGTEPRVAERTLDRIFDLSKRWNTVSLLDEADVLLCKRNSAEMDRNAVVGVFLRKLEYFQGVLFLTTNRKQDFDDAFKSRIHVTISYPALSHEAQSTIWKRLIETNIDIKRDGSWTDSAFAALGKLNLNGRTIKNILRTAVAYASAKDHPLGVDHVLTIVETELRESSEDNEDANMSKSEREKRDQVREAIKHLQQLVQGEVRTEAKILDE